MQAVQIFLQAASTVILVGEGMKKMIIILENIISYIVK